MSHTPETTNWVPNPSFETNTTGWTIVSGGTMTRVSDLAFSGTYSLELEDTSTPTGVSIAMTNWIPVVSGQGVYVAFRALARQANASVNVQVVFRDSIGGEISGFHPDLDVGVTTNSFEWTTCSDYMEAEPGSVECRIFALFTTTTGAATGDKWLVDAFELRIDQPLDGYFDGDSPDSSWTGTAHASASVREAIHPDYFQSHDSEDFTVAYRVWTVDDDLNDDIELTEWVDGGKVVVDIEQDVKRSAVFEFKNLAVLDPFVTRLKVYMEKYVENILVANEPLGVFAIDMPDGTVEWTNRHGSVDANDITIELADSARGKSFTYTKGKYIVDNAEDRVRVGRGYKANFPADTKKFTKTERFPAWTNDLELVNTLLEMANFRNIYGDGNGIITTQRIRKLSQTSPRVKIRAHEVFEIVETNDIEQLCNVVKVYKDDPDGDPIFAIERNDDPADPVSTVNMRYKAKVISDSEVDSQTEAQELAEATLEEGKSFEKTLKITIVPNPYLGIYNVLDLTFDQEDGTCYCGRYWIRSWEIPLGAAFMTANINRVQKFHDGLPDA
jgi:hypothetical protein